VFLLQILALVPLGAFIPEAGGARGAAFAAGAAALFAILAVLWLLAGRGDSPEYRRANRLFVTGTAACAAILAATILLPADVRVIAWLGLDAAYLAGFAVMIAMASPILAAALTITGALIERFGLLIIIVLGETVLGVVDGLAHAPTDPLTLATGLATGLATVTIGFGAWWTYFDFAGHRIPRPTRVATVQWILTHLPLTAAIAAMGAAMVSLVEHAHDPRGPAATVWLLCLGTAIALSSTMVLAASLQDWHRDRALYRPLARTSLAVATLCTALAALRPAPLPLALTLVILLGIPWAVAVTHHATHTQT
jgi:low temperature requirement protein LtrA